MKEAHIEPTHSFLLSDVEKYGTIEKALIMKELRNMAVYRLRVGKDGYVYYSSNALSEKFPYLNEKSIDRWLQELEKDGHLLVDRSGKRNAHKYDKTKWFLPSTVPQYDKSVPQNEEHCPQNEATIPSLSNTLSISYDVSEKEGPVYELELVPDEDQLPTSTFGKKKRTKEVPQTKLATYFIDELVDRQGIPSLDGYNPKASAEKVVETFKLSLQTVLKFDKAELTDEVIMTQWGLFLDLVKTKNSFHWQNMTSMNYVNNNLQKIIKSIM